jgi:hypothetical protein
MIKPEELQALMRRPKGWRLLRPWLADGRRWHMSLLPKASPVPYFGSLDVRFSKDDWMAMDRLVNAELSRTAPLASKLVGLGLVFRAADLPRMEMKHELESETRQDTDGGPTFFLTQLQLPTIFQDCVIKSVADLLPLTVAADKLGIEIEKTFIGALTEMMSDKPKPGLAPSGKRWPEPMVARSVEEAVQRLYAVEYYGPYIIVRGVARTFEHKPFKPYSDPEAALVQFEKSDEVESTNLHSESCFVLQTTPDVIRAVVGLDPVLVHWPTKESPENMRILACVVPQFRTDYLGNLAVVEVK